MKKRGVLTKSKAQASFEYIILFSLFIAILFIVLYYASTTTNNFIKIHEIDDSVKTLTERVNQIGAMAPGSEKIISYKIPSEILEAYINKGEITFKEEYNELIIDHHYPTDYSSFGFLTIGKSKQHVILRKEDNGYVSINPLRIPNITKDMILYLNFELGNSTHTIDATGNNNHGEYYISSLPDCSVDGILGTACEFDNSDRIDFATSITNNSIKFTLSSWFKTSDTGNNGIMSIGVSSGTWRLIILNNGKINFTERKGNSDDNFNLLSTTTYNDNEWHLVTTTWDGTPMPNSVKLYMDGSLVSSTTAKNYSTDYFFTKNMTIGNGNAPGYFFNGNLDEIMIWNRTLTANEVFELYEITGPNKN